MCVCVGGYSTLYICHCWLQVLILLLFSIACARSQIFVLQGCCFMCELLSAFVSLSHHFLLLLGEQRADTLKENKWICFVSHFQVRVCLPVLHIAAFKCVL